MLFSYLPIGFILFFPLLIGIVIFCVHWLWVLKRRASAHLLPDLRLTLWNLIGLTLLAIGLALIVGVPFSFYIGAQMEILVDIVSQEGPCFNRETACTSDLFAYRNAEIKKMGSSIDAATLELATRYLLAGIGVNKDVCFTKLYNGCTLLDQIPSLSPEMGFKRAVSASRNFIVFFSFSGYMIGLIMIYIWNKIQKRLWAKQGTA